MEIRKVQPDDRNAIREICLETCSDEELLQNKEVLYLFYCDYYLNEEADNCFVAIDNNQIVGYILSSLSYKKYTKIMKEKYLPEAEKLSLHLAKQKKKWMISDYILGPKYPAHLHIDITKDARGKGTGKALINALLENLKEKKVKGLKLGCNKNNTSAVAFYKKMNFKIIFSLGSGYIFGMNLKKKV